jgi:hypothetical protein
MFSKEIKDNINIKKLQVNEQIRLTISIENSSNFKTKKNSFRNSQVISCLN